MLQDSWIVYPQVAIQYLTPTIHQIFFKVRTMRLTVLLLMALSGTVSADTIHLKNGDQITGEIIALWDDEVRIEPTYSDEFGIDMSEVVSIETDNELDIEFEDGREGDYSFAGANEHGIAVLKSEEEEILVSYDEIRKVVEIEEFFEWKSNIDLNQSVSRGNTDSDAANINGSLTLKWGDHRTIFDLSTARENNEGSKIKEYDRLNATYNWTFSGPWFVGANASIERDPIALLDHRASLNPAIGYDIWDDPGRTFNVQLGAGYQSEKIENQTETGGVVDWRLRYSQDLIGGDLEFFHNHQIYKSLSGRENMAFISITGLRYEITDDIYLNVQLNYDHDSEPAEDTEAKNLTYVFGAGLKF
jgi:putative salt-induced outer membrane protein YdiY